jgi:cytochrome b6-f complex iron-sulfur subunit
MGDGTDRRGFLAAVIKGSAALISAITVIPGVGMLLSPVLFRPKPKERKVVFANLQDSQSTTYVTARLEGVDEAAPGVFVKRGPDGKPIVLSSLCTHAGCTVSWKPADSKFFCACHQGYFDADGKNIAGPPPKPLSRLAVVERNGAIYVREPEV